MKAMRRALALVVALVLAPETAVAEPIMQVHESIFLCADEPSLLAKLASQLDARVTLIDGGQGQLPPDWSKVTLAVFGRHDGAAAKCALQHPQGQMILELVRLDAELADARAMERPKTLGAKIAGEGRVTQYNDRDARDVANWFADICFAETSESCDFDGPAEFVRLTTDPLRQ